MALVRGIDASSYQTVTSWSAVRRAGIRFAVIKATEGPSFTSPTFRRYTSGARGARLLVGSYHFAKPAASSASTQAAFYVRQLKAAGFRSGRDLPPVLDIEETGGKGSSSLTTWCLGFVREVDRLLGLSGTYRRCGFYSNRDFYNNRLDGARLRSGRWWWQAYWPSGQSQPTRDDQMPTGAAIWQWTDNGRVGGVSGPVDLNVARLAVLRQLAPTFYGSEDDVPAKDVWDYRIGISQFWQNVGNFPSSSWRARDLLVDADARTRWLYRRHATLTSVVKQLVESVDSLEPATRAALLQALAEAAEEPDFGTEPPSTDLEDDEDEDLGADVTEEEEEAGRGDS